MDRCGPMAEVDPAWLPREAFRALRSRRVVVHGTGVLVDTVRAEVGRAGGELVSEDVDLVLAVSTVDDVPAGLRPALGTAGREGFALGRRDGVTAVVADAPAGLLHGLFHVVRL